MTFAIEKERKQKVIELIESKPNKKDRYSNQERTLCILELLIEKFGWANALELLSNVDLENNLMVKALYKTFEYMGCQLEGYEDITLALLITRLAELNIGLFGSTGTGKSAGCWIFTNFLYNAI
ncbi:MAG: hypothetical protein ACFFBD_21770, partial [Candidatus Hodarchaeota archaeon]